MLQVDTGENCVSISPSDFPPGAFDRLDQDDDSVFYVPPRLVTHIDDLAIAALSQFYGKVLRPGSVVLDLMSSWVSHLPAGLTLTEVIGHGMNEQELAANPRLTRWFVQDLNRDTALSPASDSIDAALCCVSVQYLQKPIEVFEQVRRVLKPGSPFIVSYSNRCFPTKAVAIWRSLDLQGHAALIKLYLERAGFGNLAVEVLSSGMDGDPLIAVTGHA
jgi:SAM-dependent methyltransferase